MCLAGQLKPTNYQAIGKKAIAAFPSTEASLVRFISINYKTVEPSVMLNVLADQCMPSPDDERLKGTPPMIPDVPGLAEHISSIQHHSE